MNSKQRRQDRRFKISIIKDFVDGLSESADIWEAKEMTAAEIIQEIRTGETNLNQMLQDDGGRNL